MATEIDLGALRTLLQQEPSSRVWEQLCKLLGGARWEKASAQWLPYAQDRLDREWPDRLRTWPAAWRQKAVAASALVRQLDVAGAQVKNVSQCVAALEARPAPLTGMSVVLGKDHEPLGPLLRAVPATLTRLWLTGAFPLDVVLACAPMARLGELLILAAPLSGPDFGRLLDALGPPLRALSVLNVWLMPTGAARLVESAHPPRLVSLSLANTRIAHDEPAVPGYKNAGIRWLASVQWPALEGLDLGDNSLDNVDELARLVAAMPALRALNLNGNPALGSRDLLPLGEALTGPLRTLGLFGCGVSDWGMARLLALKTLQGLTELDLRSNQVGRATGLALRGEAGAQLERLDLTWCAHQGAMELAQSLEGGTLPALRTLGVIPRTDFIEAMSRVAMPSLRRLTHEHGNAMPRSVVEAVQRAPWGAQLEDVTGAGER